MEEGREYKTNVAGKANLPDASRRKELIGDVAARQHNTFVQARPSNSAELLQALKYIRPQIEGYLNTRDAVGRTEAFERGQLDAQKQDVSLDSIPTAIEVPPEATAAPAYDPSYARGVASAVGQRLGSQAVAMRLADHEANKLKDDYDPLAAAQQFKAQDLTGLEQADPLIATKVLSDVNSLEGKLLLDTKNIRLAKLKEATLNDVDANTYNAIVEGGGDPERVGQAWEANRQVSLSASQPYRSLNEMDEANLGQSIRYSNENGGTPQLFDAFTRKRADGYSIVDKNPELGAKVAIARAQAQAKYEQRLEQTNQAANFMTLASLEAGWDVGQYISPQYIAELTGPGKPFSTASAALSWYHKQAEKIATQQEYVHMGRLGGTGNLNAATPEAQKRFLEGATREATAGLDQILNDPEQMQHAQQVLSQTLNYVAKAGASIPLDWAVRKYTGLAQAAPAQNSEPTPMFLNMAKAYEGIPDHLKDSYATGDAKALMDAYMIARRNGNSEAEAYTLAYRGISPENKKAVEERKKDPEFRKKMVSMRDTAINKASSNWFKDVDNSAVVMGSLGTYMESWIAQNPGASEDDLQSEMTRYVSRNFIHDTSTNKYVGVPTSVGEGAKETVSFYMNKIREEVGAENKPFLSHRGNGNYDVMWSPGGGDAVVPLRQITWGQIDSMHRKSFVTAEDEAALRELNKKVASGTLKAADLGNLEELSGKLRAAGRDGDLPIQAINKIYEDQFNDYFSSVINVKASDAPATSPKGTGDPYGRDTIVKQYLSSNGITDVKTGTSNYKDLAKALIATREGVRLSVYNDPARGAGKNIGIGYNLGSRTKEQVLRDFRAARIPTGYYDDILSGKRELTSDQARMLLDATFPQYERIAESTINGVRAGYWDHMPASQRAVIIDMAYQLGPQGLSKFKSSINAVVTEQAHTMDNIFKVQYTDRSGKTGLDTQGYALRAALWNRGAAGFASYLYANNYLKE
ncbi:hypothetical protein NB640_12415 [Oxalobacter vibrioformis]|uniref:Uncharacterized protein n=1 Tax=Oxalobacter vibrioformis TaxID=933080 RepID=A0A9E9P2L2_9BURK|nr:hypothetical protein [Oxalobacter vibrioformis]WAW10004.1 hypothetical protein NB640_12415 [Oxalobacter vibrioformis]